MYRYLSAIGTLLLVLYMGCAEGPAWKTGKYVPWVQQKWRAEEQLADTLFARKRMLSEELSSARRGSVQSQIQLATKLREIVQRDTVSLMRIHAVELLGQLNNAESVAALELASKDPDTRVRMAAIWAWRSYPPETAAFQLQEILGSDTNVDVRLEAIRTLGQIGHPAGTKALAHALTDANPAIQYRATEALASITGAKIGSDVGAWQNYLSTQSPDRLATPDNFSNQR